MSPRELEVPTRLRVRVRVRALDWIGVLFAAAALVLVPWVVFLVRALPSDHRSAHWDVAWGGFDVALALLLVGAAVAAWRRSPWLEGAAAAAATLLFVDAWFDVLTASSRAELIAAILEAALVELPMAVFCVLIARSVERRLAVAASLPARRGEHAGALDPLRSAPTAERAA
jgi:membrane-associated protease RseP (regulator of RpoE activity)